MVTINYGGRLGNNLLQYISAYFFAKKFNLSLVTPPINNNLNFGDFFNLNNCNGSVDISHSILITDDNFLDYLKQTKIQKLIIYFQVIFRLKII